MLIKESPNFRIGHYFGLRWNHTCFINFLDFASHDYNEKYKTWTLLKKFSSKIKISIIEHGGNHADLNWNFGYDRILGDEFFSWHKSNNKKKLPVPKYIGFKSKISERKNLIYCGYESTKYPSKISRSPFGIENLKSILPLSI